MHDAGPAIVRALHSSPQAPGESTGPQVVVTFAGLPGSRATHPRNASGSGTTSAPHGATSGPLRSITLLSGAGFLDSPASLPPSPFAWLLFIFTLRRFPLDAESELAAKVCPDSPHSAVTSDRNGNHEESPLEFLPNRMYLTANRFPGQLLRTHGPFSMLDNVRKQPSFLRSHSMSHLRGNATFGDDYRVIVSCGFHRPSR
jgi:hypothetical protein